MISIVMPFYKKYREFLEAFEKNNFNAFNEHPSLELVISVDDPADSEELLAYLKQKTSDNCCFSIKILLNRETHTWRCPSKAINQGIKQAAHDKIIVLSPETLILPNSLLQLEKYCNTTNFSFGIIKHATNDQINFDDVDKSFQTIKSMLLPYGSICFTKEQAFNVGGYDENFITWGGDDDDFRNRLSLAGYWKKPTFAKFIHVTFSKRVFNRSQDKDQEKSRASVLKKIEGISSRTDPKVESSLLTNESVEKVFEFKPAQPTVVVES
jgi:hypothetical protein